MRRLSAYDVRQLREARHASTGRHSEADHAQSEREDVHVKLRAVLTAPARAGSALARMVFKRNPVRFFGMPRSKFDFLSEVGDGTGSSTVMAPLLWIARSFPEAPLGLWKTNSDGLEDQLLDHPLLRLMRRPNAFYSGRALWMATVTDWNVDGNAYWLKLRDRGGRLAELWWVPHWMVEPRGTETEFITHYEYKPGSDPIKLGPDEVVHFRFGLDGDNPRKGYSPLKSVLREVFTDDEAANFTASLLRNMGVPGLVVSPDGDGKPSDEDVKATKAYIKAMFAGDSRGEALVMSAATKVSEFGFSPEQLTLKDVRRIPEERVSAVIGVPAVVAGLGAGLDRSTFTNYGEAREAAYEQAVIPTQTLMAEDIWFQLLPDFEAIDDIWTWRVGFDLKNVRVLQEDRFNLAKRLDLGVRGGWVRVAEGRRAAGLPVTDLDEIYLRQMNLVQVPADGSKPQQLTPPRAPQRPSINGNAAHEPELAPT
jgi:HK97 family phage portal protein